MIIEEPHKKKIREFREGVIKFILSPKGRQEILDFSIVCCVAYMAGSGIGADEAKRIIDEEMDKKEKS